MCDECGGTLAQTEIDDMAQNLFGVIAALNAYLRRSAATDGELTWALQQLTATQQRLSRASRNC
jgi:hypothetical protein